jgi:hypothetical protein
MPATVVTGAASDGDGTRERVSRKDFPAFGPLSKDPPLDFAMR